MTPEFPAIARYFWLLILVIVTVDLLYGRRRAAALVTAGLVTQEDLDGFVRGAAITVGGLFLLFGFLQLATSTPDPMCLVMFPPRSTAGLIMWLAQGFFSAGIVWCLWARDGARVLAAFAPAFTRGPVLERKFSPVRVRLVVSAVLVIAPIGNIAVQLVSGPLLVSCSAA